MEVKFILIDKSMVKTNLGSHSNRKAAILEEVDTGVLRSIYGLEDLEIGNTFSLTLVCELSRVKQDFNFGLEYFWHEGDR